MAPGGRRNEREARVARADEAPDDAEARPAPAPRTPGDGASRTTRCPRSASRTSRRRPAPAASGTRAAASPRPVPAGRGVARNPGSSRLVRARLARGFWRRPCVTTEPISPTVASRRAARRAPLPSHAQPRSRHPVLPARRLRGPRARRAAPAGGDLRFRQHAAAARDRAEGRRRTRARRRGPARRSSWPPCWRSASACRCRPSSRHATSAACRAPTPRRSRAHYGSVSVGTYRRAGEPISAPQGIDYEARAPVWVVVLEVPAILAGILLARGFSAGVAWKPLLRELLLGRSIVLLLGGLAIGWIAGPDGTASIAAAVLRPVQGHPRAVPAGDGADRGERSSARCAATPCSWSPSAC